MISLPDRTRSTFIISEAVGTNPDESHPSVKVRVHDGLDIEDKTVEKGILAFIIIQTFECPFRPETCSMIKA